MRPGSSSEEPFTVTLTSSPEIRALVSASLSPEDQTVAADASGNGNNGALVGGPAWGQDSQRRHLAFDGGDDRVVVPNSPSLSTPDAVTVAAWVYSNGTQFNFSKPVSTGSYGIAVSPGGNAVYARISTSSGVVDTNLTPVPLPHGEWVHLAMIYDRNAPGDQLKLYLGGTIRATKPSTGTLDPPTTDLVMGKHETAALFWHGKIADVRVYARALSPAEVQDLVSGSAPSSDPSLRGRWPLDHGITPGFDGRLSGELALQGATIWGPAPLADLVAESPVFLAVLAGGQTVEPTLRVAWPNGTPEEDNPFQGARFVGDITVDAVQTVGSIFDSCVDLEGLALPGVDSVAFLGGKAVPEWGDPGCASTRGFPRMTGLYADFQVTPGTPGAGWAVGFVSGSSLSDFQHVVLFHGGGGIYLDDDTSVTAVPGAGSTNVGSWAAGSTYRVRIMLKKAGGATYWLQGPGFAPLGGGAWTKVGESAIGTAASLSPTASNLDQVGTITYLSP